MLMLVILLGIVGARLYHVFSSQQGATSAGRITVSIPGLSLKSGTAAWAFMARSLGDCWESCCTPIAPN